MEKGPLAMFQCKPAWCCASAVAVIFFLLLTVSQYREYKDLKADFTFATERPRPELPAKLSPEKTKADSTVATERPLPKELPAKPSSMNLLDDLVKEAWTNASSGNSVRGYFEAAKDLDSNKVASIIKLSKDLGLPENIVIENPYRAEMERKAREREAEENAFFVSMVQENMERWDRINADIEGYSIALIRSFIGLCLSGLLLIFSGFVFIVTLPGTVLAAYSSMLKLPQRVNSPAKRIGAIVSVLSFIYFIYKLILWYDYRGTQQAESLLYAIILFLACISILFGIPQRVIEWIKHGK